MNRKTIAIWTTLGILTLVATTLSFVKFFISLDYRIVVEDECDSMQGNCFVYEEEGEILFYRKVIWKAASIPRCDPDDDGCEVFDCEGKPDCTVEYCDERTKAGDEICADSLLVRQPLGSPDEDAEETAS